MEEQQSSKKKKSSAVASVTESLAPPPVALTDEERSQYEALITSLYQQLDDKVSLQSLEAPVSIQGLLSSLAGLFKVRGQQWTFSLVS